MENEKGILEPLFLGKTNRFTKYHRDLYGDYSLWIFVEQHEQE